MKKTEAQVIGLSEQIQTLLFNTSEAVKADAEAAGFGERQISLATSGALLTILAFYAVEANIPHEQLENMLGNALNLAITRKHQRTVEEGHSG